MLLEIRTFLKPFYKQTKRTKGFGIGDGHKRLQEIIIGFKYLLDHMEAWVAFYKDPTVKAIQQS